jgi:hypothetical protein
MTRSLAWSTIGLCAFAAILPAQQVSVPVLGYLWDSRTHNLRPLLGTPGASSPGSPLDTKQSIAAAVAQQDFAVVLSGDAREAALLRPETPGALRVLQGVHPGASAVELSPAGSAAAFYFPAERLIQIVSGLPGRPSSPTSISLLSLRNPLASFTVSDDGQVLLCAEAAGTADGSPAAAVVLGAAGELNRIALSGAVTASAFLDGSHDALLASGRELVLVRDVVAGIRLPQGAAAIAPTLLAFTPYGRRAILADSRTGLLAVQNLEAPDEPLAVVDCHCHPTALSRLNADGVWRLTGDLRATVHLFEWTGGTARVLSVPPRIESQ